MPRPKSKPELESSAADTFSSLFELVEGIDLGDRMIPGVNGQWSVKDILSHLHVWHTMMYGWYALGSKGEKPDIPAKGYTWKTTPDLNQKIFEEHKGDSYETVVENLQASHKKIMRLISSHTDDELFTKKKYAWTGSTSLGAYLISATSSHYQWAIDLIKKWQRSL